MNLRFSNNKALDSLSAIFDIEFVTFSYFGLFVIILMHKRPRIQESPRIPFGG